MVGSPISQASGPYLLIGAGRLSRHLGHYFDLESIAWRRWERSNGSPLRDAIAGVGAILLLISDDAIEDFLQDNARPGDPAWVHCSGSLVTALAGGIHPLMTFSDELYDHQVYRQIPFICERGRTPFRRLFPQLANPSFEIDPGDKPLYHALSAMAGNFTTLLWGKAFADFEQRLDLPRDVLYPYLDRVADNLKHSASPLTGPLNRGDRRTVESHLAALAGDGFDDVYRAFVAAHGHPSRRSQT